LKGRFLINQWCLIIFWGGSSEGALMKIRFNERTQGL
jgi:hypothetical protein